MTIPDGSGILFWGQRGSDGSKKDFSGRQEYGLKDAKSRDPRNFTKAGNVKICFKFAITYIHYRLNQCGLRYLIYFQCVNSTKKLKFAVTKHRKGILIPYTITNY